MEVKIGYQQVKSVVRFVGKLFGHKPKQKIRLEDTVPNHLKRDKGKPL